MAALDNEIREGLARQETGDWAAALACYSRVIAKAPDHVRGLFLAGVAQARTGNLEASSVLLSRCLALQPDFAPAVQTLGSVLLSQRKHEQAAAVLEQARSLSPASAAIHFDLGVAYLALNRVESAAECYRTAIILQPDFADAHNNLGTLLVKQGRLDDAVGAFEQALRASARHARAWFNLGTARQLQDRFPAALEAYRQALTLDPGNHSAENNFGLLLRAEGRFAEALAAFRRADALKPNDPTILVNLAAALQDVNKAEESLVVLAAVLARVPDDYRALTNLGNAYVALNQPAAGIAAYEQALAIAPVAGEVRYNIALAHLVMGDFERGWAGYDARLESEHHRKLYAFDQPRWYAGQPLSGRTLVVYAEQGLGDTIQFVRYVPLLAAQGARVVVRVQSPLQPLLAAQPTPATFITAGDPLPDYDLQCPLLSLPREFATRLDSIPTQASYLRAPQAKVAAWRNVFALAGGLKVGLVWSGNPKHQYDHNRSIPFALLAALAADVPAHFFALQKEQRETDREELAAAPRITDLSGKMADFADTAAIVTALDLVITVDTSVAHLAGALGARTWVLLGYAPDWRWLLQRADSPWYPSIRLFRQSAPGDWASVLRELRTALVALTREHRKRGVGAEPET